MWYVGNYGFMTVYDRYKHYYYCRTENITERLLALLFHK